MRRGKKSFLNKILHEFHVSAMPGPLGPFDLTPVKVLGELYDSVSLDVIRFVVDILKRK
jgi:hypothetical protein